MEGFLHLHPPHLIPLWETGDSEKQDKQSLQAYQSKALHSIFMNHSSTALESTYEHRLSDDKAGN